MRPEEGVTRASQEIGSGPSLSFPEPTQLLRKVTHLPERIPTPRFPISRDLPLHLTSQVPGRLEWSPYRWVSLHQLSCPQTWNGRLCLPWLSK